MGLLVQKYGGTSVGTPERIHAVADRIAAARAEGYSMVVVVSAMGQSTDELIELAYRVSKSPPHREMDMLLTTGERISMALLSMALADRKVPAISLTGSQSGILTDGSHRRARIKKILGDRIRRGLSEGQVVIVAGFQGVSEQKEITTLGRGGSDTTAVALAATLGADLCEIYTDVDGVYSADPRKVPEARLWSRMPHDLMVELAVRGAGVLHPRSVELAKQYGVPLRVRNSMNQKQGTEVTSQLGGEAELCSATQYLEDFRVVGVTADAGKALVSVELMRQTVLAALYDEAGKAHLSVVAPLFHDGHVFFYAEKDAEEDWKHLLQKLAQEDFIKSWEFNSAMVPLSVVGDRFTQDGTALARIFDVLARAGVDANLGAASSLAVTVAVKATHADDAVRAVHRQFLESSSGGGES